MKEIHSTNSQTSETNHLTGTETKVEIEKIIFKALLMKTEILGIKGIINSLFADLEETKITSISEETPFNNQKANLWVN